ncbi:MAG TPA: phage holin family protein [Mycobacteriales bacterium]|jgi:hypothetical protein
MTYPDSGAPADPRDELEAIRRRLDELTPAGPRGPGNGLLVAGGLALTGALAVLLIAIAVASTLDGGAGQAAVLIAGFCIVAGFAVLGLSLLRRWQDRAAEVRRQRLELLTRYDTLVAEMGQPRGSASQPAYRSAYQPAPNRNDRFRMVAALILAVLVLLVVLTVVVARLA